jgi:pSer/pThr/pTyr-binding forkhead associated (FHA) protein
MADARLEVNDGLGRRVILIDKPLLAIGRRSENDLRLVGSDVSRDHAEIVQVEGGAFLLRDRGSRYGTFVNGDQITEHPLRHGDRIQFGRTSGTEVVFLADGNTLTDRPQQPTAFGDLRQLAVLLEGCGRSGRAVSSTRCSRWCSIRRSRSPVPSVGSSCWPTTAASSR